MVEIGNGFSFFGGDCFLGRHGFLGRCNVFGRLHVAMHSRTINLGTASFSGLNCY